MDYDSKDLSFDRPPLIPPLEKGGMWELEKDWCVFYKGDVYCVPAGFKTDGASIPRFLWRVCGTPLDAPRVYAAIVHDWLYSGGDVKASRADADAIYRDMQIALGVSRFKACVEWTALRWFGGSHWYENTKMKEGSKMSRIVMLAAVAAAAGLVCGCATKTRNVEIDGLFTQAEAGILAVGSVDVMAAPVGEESAIIKYEEDVALLSPSTKTHSIKIQLTGTNSTTSVTSLVSSICRAFVPTAAIVNGVMATNVVKMVER